MTAPRRGADALVSVVVPVHQRRHCVLDAIESVLVQTHSHVECIVVDDGSTDGSYDLAAERARDDERVRVFRIEHGGVSAARNRGLDAAAGEVVTFLDSDDVMARHRVERQLGARAELGCDGVIARADVRSVDGAPLPVWFEKRPGHANEYYWTSLLVDVEPVRAVGGFDVSLEVGEDIELLVRLREAGLRIEALDDVLTNRRYFGDNLTYRIGENENALRDAIRRHVARRRAADRT